MSFRQTGQAPTVVKLGGSTAQAAELHAWIAALAGSTAPLVIVPGGGPFADRVRETQPRIGFSDAAAHAMAILAMDQFGHVILDGQDRLVAARSLEEISDALARQKSPVWLPSALAIGAPGIAASWGITSDSLAAWLAGKLGAGTLLLVKQTSAFSADDDIASLTARGIVDAGLEAMLPAKVALRLACPADVADAAAELAAGRLPGRSMRTTAMRRAG